MRSLLLLTLSAGFLWTAAGGFPEDSAFLKRVERRLEEIDRLVREKGFDRRLADELNSYGYPLHRIRERYRDKAEAADLYRRADRAYKRILLF